MTDAALIGQRLSSQLAQPCLLIGWRQIDGLAELIRGLLVALKI
jgi:hypothetical protein